MDTTCSHIKLPAPSFLHDGRLPYWLMKWASENPHSRFVHVICSGPDEYSSCARRLRALTGLVNLDGSPFTVCPHDVFLLEQIDRIPAPASPSALTTSSPIPRFSNRFKPNGMY